MLSEQQIAVTVSERPAVAPSRQAVQAKTASKAGKVTGNLKVAIDLMIEEALDWDKAAVQAGLTVRSMRLALERPHVVAYLKAAKDVFRARISAANIHHLAKIRDKSGNAMAQLGAIKQLEADERNSTAGSSASQSPGVVVQIITGGPVIQHDRHIDAKPLITFDGVHDGE